MEDADQATALELALTEDVRRSIAALRPLDGERVLALGDGPALMAVELARSGARITIVDISLPRLRTGRALVRRLGLEDRVDFVVGTAEDLPLADASVARAATKSVLIHTRLPESAGELARVLSPGGRFALIEPTPHHPLVAMYRRTLAPSSWRTITTYIGPRELRTIRVALTRGGVATRVERSHLFGFLATPFAFSFRMPRVFHALERFLCGVDRLLFALIPPLSGRAWFLIIHGRRSRS